AQIRLGLQDRRLGLTLLRPALVHLRELNIASRRKLNRAPQLLIGVDKPRLGGDELRLALVSRRLEGLALDRENHLALFDAVAFFEQASPEETGHTRSQIDLFERLGAPDKFGLLGHRAEFRQLEKDRRRWSSLLSVRRQADHG